MTIHTVLTLSALLVGLSSLLTWSEFRYLGFERRVRPDPCWTGSTYTLSAFTTQILPLALVLLCWLPPARAIITIALALQAARFCSSVDFGREGSDEIALVVLVPLAIACASPSLTVTKGALVFIAAQLVLSYLAAAWSKLAGPKWRSGVAVPQILSTSDYGLGIRELHDDNRLILRSLSWLTIAAEILIPVWLILGGPFTIPALAMGAFFHVTVAVMMGLNRFVPWFATTYPAALWVSVTFGVLSR